LHPFLKTMTDPKTISRIDTWTWVLIFVGLVFTGIGIALSRSTEWLGHVVTGLGVAGILTGAFLVWLRSRMKDD
jgi:cytochrome b subunit of formate dehydrogenase